MWLVASELTESSGQPAARLSGFQPLNSQLDRPYTNLSRTCHLSQRLLASILGQGLVAHPPPSPESPSPLLPAALVLSQLWRSPQTGALFTKPPGAAPAHLGLPDLSPAASLRPCLQLQAAHHPTQWPSLTPCTII